MEPPDSKFTFHTYVKPSWDNDTDMLREMLSYPKSHTFGITTSYDYDMGIGY